MKITTTNVLITAASGTAGYLVANKLMKKNTQTSLLFSLLFAGIAVAGMWYKDKNSAAIITANTAVDQAATTTPEEPFKTMQEQTAFYKAFALKYPPGTAMKNNMVLSVDGYGNYTYINGKWVK